MFKYGGHLELRHLFTQSLIHFVEQHNLPIYDCDLIVPVPLHPARYRERSFNQSQLIAIALSKHFQIPCDPFAVTRVRYTPNQARVNSKQRWTNMQETFKIGTINIDINRNILIVDDLLTTGATLSEISLVFKNAGAQKVYGLTAAIAV
ncbi:MAG: hypothetical protein AB1650_04725 [Candidatus Omnitrophota bacterium]